MITQKLKDTVFQIEAIYDDRMDGVAAPKIMEMQHFQGQVNELKQTAAMKIVDPTNAIREGASLADLRQVMADAKLASDDIKVLEAVIDVIRGEIESSQKSLAKSRRRVRDGIDTLLINKQRYQIAIANGERDAGQYSRAFSSNLNAFTKHLNDDEIPVKLIKELQDELEFVEQISMTA